MTTYQKLLADLRAEPRRWLITGVAGFIGSHLLETLLRHDQTVAGLDNLSTGSPRNLDAVQAAVNEEQWARFAFHQGSVADIGICREASRGADYVIHQAGFISVPLSIEDPVACHDTNVTGTLNLLVAARDNGARRVVYASSSAVYGDETSTPAREDKIGSPLSPYGASKAMSEMYARLFTQHYGVPTVGLRYFNIFGPRQNPTGGYAAVIPQWIAAMIRGDECCIHGDGSATRDFCFVANVVQANLLAAVHEQGGRVTAPVFNVGLGGETTIKELYDLIARKITVAGMARVREPRFGPERPGDILHSTADISAISKALHFDPEVSLDAGLEETVRWYGTAL